MTEHTLSNYFFFLFLSFVLNNLPWDKSMAKIGLTYALSIGKWFTGIFILDFF